MASLPDPSWPPGREAPPGLEPLRRFVNTANLETGADRLATRATAQAWLVGEGHAGVRNLDAGALEQIVAVRELVRGRLDSGAGSEARSTVDLAFSAVAAALSYRIRFSPTVVLEPVQTGVAGVLAVLLLGAYEAERNGTWTRLKVCRRCQWAFYDRSKNASGTWCAAQVCGARSKAAAYRGRRKALAGG